MRVKKKIKQMPAVFSLTEMKGQFENRVAFKRVFLGFGFRRSFHEENDFSSIPAAHEFLSDLWTLSGFHRSLVTCSLRPVCATLHEMNVLR